MSEPKSCWNCTHESVCEFQQKQYRLLEEMSNRGFSVGRDRVYEAIGSSCNRYKPYEEIRRLLVEAQTVLTESLQSVPSVVSVGIAVSAEYGEHLRVFLRNPIAIGLPDKVFGFPVVPRIVGDIKALEDG